VIAKAGFTVYVIEEHYSKSILIGQNKKCYGINCTIDSRC